MNMIPGWIKHARDHRKLRSGLLCLIALWIIALIDYSLGYQISLLVFYILPIGFATLYAGPAFATFLAILAVVLWKGGDFLSGAPNPGLPVLIWNGTIVISLFAIVIYLLNALQQALAGLESTLDTRTISLWKATQERSFLQKEILDLAERECQWFGHETHVVCQKLAGLSIAAHVLVGKLTSSNHEEAAHARELAKLVDDALANARIVAKGLFTAGFDSAGLLEVLRETARLIQEQNHLRCEVRSQENLAFGNEASVIHLFRIAQEAMQNAARHSTASQIIVSLARQDQAVCLAVEDNGKGITTSDRHGKGLGLRIMAYRAGIIGGELKIEQIATGGTRILCLVPVEKMATGTSTR
jgi:signal transduction histidine kinase